MTISGSSVPCPDLDFRVLSGADTLLVSALAAGVLEGDNSFPIEQLEREMSGNSEKAPPEGRVVFGGSLEGRLVATGCGLVEEGGLGYVSRIYVSPDARARGVGRRLVNHIESHLAARGCRKSYLYFWGPDRSAQRFWVRMGYARVCGIGHVHDEGLGYVVKAERLLAMASPVT
ncbi:MAG: GNAT family N-acetyltransferase [Planctomycetota bacterium]